MPVFDRWRRKQNKQMRVSRYGHNPRIIVCWGKSFFCCTVTLIESNVDVERKHSVWFVYLLLLDPTVDLVFFPHSKVIQMNFRK